MTGDSHLGSLIRHLLHLRSGSPVLFLTLVVWLVAELVMALAAPSVIPDHTYLSWYVGPEARANTSKILNDQAGFLLFDSSTGWKNRPNTSRGKWHIDENGSRSTHPFGLERVKPIRALFLGSSLTNGGTGVENSQTISAQIEDSITEAVNFATMLYSLDQMYLAYATGLHRYQASVVVVGLPGDPEEGLSNRYVPLRNRGESNIPYLKPRFALNNGQLQLLPMPPRSVWQAAFENSGLVDSLRTTDGYFSTFWTYERFGQTPLSAGVSYLFGKARSVARLLRANEDPDPLMLSLMARFVQQADSNHATVIFMLLPESKVTFPPLWRRFLPDHYGQLIAKLRALGYSIVDGRQALTASGRTPGELYIGDGQHFTPEGNRAIAGALRPLLPRRP
jgi:hypothetical protein